ncbi:hypothetical protein ACHAXT_009534 [Thalassiosira profunda]
MDLLSHGGGGGGLGARAKNGGGSGGDGRGDGNGGGGGGGGGMSRAAKKRAKKRARSAASGAPTSATATNGSAGPASNNGGGGGEGKKQKMQLPLDDNNDGDGANNGGEDLLGTIKLFRKESSGKSKKRKKKRKKDKSEEGTEALVESAAAAANETNPVDPEAAMEADDVSLDGAEMAPELKALLATLSPRQILMLDGGVGKIPAALEEHGSDSNAKNPEAGEDEEEAKTAAGMPDEAEDEMADEAAGADDMLAGIDPLQIVGDLATEHRARILLLSLLAPSGVTLREFYNRYWGQRPLLACLDHGDEEDDGETNIDAEDEAILRKHATRLDGFLDRASIHEMIERNKLRYGLDLNVTNYTDATGNGVRRRITLDPPPKKRKMKGGSRSNGDELEYVVANPNDVWSNVDSSRCSLRLLRPHEHSDAVHSLLSLLESEFGCMVGSNAYLTPLHSQGFAPHYDDVDVFILQLEGFKRWRVHAPFNKRETLPRESSRDYSQKEVEEGGEEILDVVLGPGDVLYLPRGWIHQAETVARPKNVPKLSGVKDDHSLHLTVSAMQKWCWADFLEVLMPEALESAATSDKTISLREGLPRNFLSYTGTMHQLDGEDGGDGPEGLKQAAAARAQSSELEEEDEEALLEARAKQETLARQKHFKEEAKKRIMRVARQALSMLDDACDQIGKRFLSDRLPPALLPSERCLTKEGLSDNSAPHHHEAAKKIWPNTLCRLARPHIARLVVEDGKAVVYHCGDNSRVFGETPLSPLEFEIDDAPALEQLLTTVEPRWIMVKDLIHGDVEDKMGIAQALFDEGILATALAEAPDRSVQTG